MDDALLPYASPPSLLLKRKCEHSSDGDDVAELFHDICLSPRNKKTRQDFSSTSFSTDSWNSCLSLETPTSSTSDIEFSEDLPNETKFSGHDFDILQVSSTPPETQTNEERAIVLYKPVNPPLFPGGPTSGYQIVVDANIFSSAGKVNSPDMLGGRTADYWLQSSDNAKNKSELFSDQMEDGEDVVSLQSEMERNNSLAVVPWMSKSPAFIVPVEVSPECEGASMGEQKEEDAAMEVDSMEMGEGHVVIASNSMKDRIDEPWQHYGVPQPHYISPMWSH